MAERPGKRDRKAALNAWKAQERAAAKARFPLSREKLSALFEVLDDELGRRECDHTLRFVREWCGQNGVEFSPLEKWLHDNGGYCDCEALGNAEEVFREAIRESGD